MGVAAGVPAGTASLGGAAGRRTLGVETSGAPHWLQNLAPGFKGLAQLGQTRSSGAPQF
jgi:hypothetical protein